VKICIDDATGSPVPEMAVAEFGALARVHEAMGAGRFSVPEPMVLREQAAEIAIEWIDGLTLRQELARRPFSVANAERLCSLAGQWLNAFHGARVLPPGALDLDDKLAQVHAMAEARPVPDRLFRSAVEFLCEAAALAGRPRLPRSWIHGDFKPDNLMVSGDRVVGVDVHASFENVVVYDLASFLNQLSLFLCSPRFVLLRISWDRLRTVLCREYGLDADPAVRLALQWVMLFQLLDMWQSAEAASRSLPRRVGLRFLVRTSCGALLKEARSTLESLAR